MTVGEDDLRGLAGESELKLIWKVGEVRKEHSGEGLKILKVIFNGRSRVAAAPPAAKRLYNWRVNWKVMIDAILCGPVH